MLNKNGLRRTQHQTKGVGSAFIGCGLSVCKGGGIDRTQELKARLNDSGDPDEVNLEALFKEQGEADDIPDPLVSDGIEEIFS